MNLYELLNNTLSPLVDGRAFADVVPQNTPVPNIRFILIGGAINYTVCDGRGVDAQVQIDLSTQKSSDRHRLQNLVQDALDELDCMQDSGPVYLWDDDLAVFRCVLTYVFY